MTGVDSSHRWSLVRNGIRGGPLNSQLMETERNGNRHCSHRCENGRSAPFQGEACPWKCGHALARIHRCGAALGLEQGVRAVGRDGPRSIPINGAGGGLWLSLGAPMAVLGSGAGAGSAGQHAGEDNRGPGRCDSVGRLGSLVDVSGAVGAVRQAMAGLAIEPGRE